MLCEPPPQATPYAASVVPFVPRDTVLTPGLQAFNLRTVLCQNCVTYPPKPQGNTVIYGDTSTHIDVAEVVESEVRWWDLMCVSTRERIQFPSVRATPVIEQRS